MFPGEMPSPVPAPPHVREASPRLWDSSILPSRPVARSVRRQRQNHQLVDDRPVLATTNETFPEGTLVGPANSVAGIGAWPIIESPASMTRMSTVVPARGGAAQLMVP